MFDAPVSLCSLLQINNDLPPPPNKHPHISPPKLIYLTSLGKFNEHDDTKGDVVVAPTSRGTREVEYE